MDSVAESDSLIPQTPPHVKQYPGLGALLGGLSGFCYACSALIVKLLHDHDTGDAVMIISWVRELVAFAGFGIAARVLRLSLFGRNKTENALLVSLGLLATIFVVTQYKAFQAIDLADANTIISSSPLFVALFSALLTFRCCSTLDAFTVITCIGGIILCVQPPIIFHPADIAVTASPGYLLALLSCVLWSLSYISSAKVKHMGVIVMNLWAASIPAIAYSAYLIATRSFHFPQSTTAMSYVFLNSFVSFVAMALLGLAVTVDDPLMVSVGRTSDLVFSFVFDVMVFGSRPSPAKVAGACMVVSGIVVPAAIRIYQNMKQNDGSE